MKKELERLLNLPAENEVFEFTEAKNQYDFNKLGKYFSALSTYFHKYCDLTFL
ncbi:MAG: hypothetical protein ABIG69_08205 [Bacteroidota bacterium]